MFRIIRYIIILILILFGLFILHKNSQWFQEKIEYTKLFFVSIRGGPVVLDDIKIDNNTKADTSKDNTNSTSTVKPLIPIPSDLKSNNTSKISVDGIIYYTNIERKKAGLGVLTKNTKLSTSASFKTDDMFTKQYFEHDSPTGVNAADLVRSVNYSFQIVGENLALGIFNTDQALVQAWMNSPTHRDNILNPKYTEMGASVGIGEYKGQRQWMAVQHFAKPLPVCGEVDQVVQKNIDDEKKLLEAEERELQKMAGNIESNPSIGNDYIDSYNNKVSTYNIRLNNLREIISNFNKTIISYNECLKK